MMLSLLTPDVLVGFRQLANILIDALPLLLSIAIALEKRFKLFSKVIEKASEQASKIDGPVTPSKSTVATAVAGGSVRDSGTSLVTLAIKGVDRQVDVLADRIEVIEAEYAGQLQALAKRVDELETMLKDLRDTLERKGII